jgi:protein-disulfide isomerase
VTLNRRDTLILAASAAALSFCGVGATLAQEGTTKDVAALANVALPDKPIGSESAPVTVIEYASPTCPHCAAFHNNVYPAFKTEYIDTGKVKFVLRPFVRNTLDAVVFMLAEAGGEAQYHAIIETYFRTQGEWGISSRPRDALLSIAKQIGFTDETFDNALKDTELFAKMETMREQALNEFALDGTPTFYVNGKQLTGDKTIEQMREAIDPLVPADFQPTTTETAPAETAPAEGTTEAPAEGTTEAPAEGATDGTATETPATTP